MSDLVDNLKKLKKAGETLEDSAHQLYAVEKAHHKITQRLHLINKELHNAEVKKHHGESRLHSARDEAAKAKISSGLGKISQYIAELHTKKADAESEKSSLTARIDHAHAVAEIAIHEARAALLKATGELKFRR
jgi:chromosome segregation ATPase